VRKGCDAIAEWRRSHPTSRLDLRRANLSGVVLREADLSLALLQKAVLTNADLRGATLTGAVLIGADLTRADLSNALLDAAILRDANLVHANLNRADLTGAIVTYADLSGANLEGANLSHVLLLSSVLGNIDLSQVVGLSTVRQAAPWSISVDTLIASFRGAGNKPTPELRGFFRGAGVPRELLDALPKIVSEIKYYSCFISYGQPDLKFAEKLREDLKGRGVDCWLYEKDKTVGKRAGHEIVIERRGAEKMVVLCSAKALVRDRFLEEIEDQINEEPDKMVPISLDDLWKEPGFRVMRGTRDLKPFVLDKNYADFANKPYDEALEELLKGLRRPAVKKPRRKKG